MLKILCLAVCLKSLLVASAAVTICPRVVVYDDGMVPVNGTQFITNSSLVLNIGVVVGNDSGTLEHSSLSLSPDVSFCDQSSNLPVYWNQDEGLWSVIVDTSECRVQCDVCIELTSSSEECGLLLWRGVYLTAHEFGPCNFTFDVVNSHLIYLHGNQSGCPIGHMVGFSTEEQSLGAGLVVDSLSESSALVAMLTSLQTSGSGEWVFRDNQCWTQLVPIEGFTQTTHEVDVWDNIQFRLRAETIVTDPFLLYHLPKHFLDISMVTSDPDLFDQLVSSSRTPTTHTLTVNLWQRNITSYPMRTSVTFRLVYCSVSCEMCSITTYISSMCPTEKHLQFVYPTTQPSDPLYNLPVNYRPPSSLGTSIHSSPHVYNVDPTSVAGIESLFSKVDIQLKQCLNKENRFECLCSADLANSTDINASDCIQMAYRHLYEVEFLLTFNLSLGGGREISLNQPIDLRELNGRTDFTVRTNQSMAIRFKGPGLYHFKASLVNSTSFCLLHTQFTVYVDRTPLPKTGEFTVTTVTTILFGLFTFTIYLFHYYRQAKRHKQTK